MHPEFNYQAIFLQVVVVVVVVVVFYVSNCGECSELYAVRKQTQAAQKHSPEWKSL